ncbi:MAG: hypothetical protein WB627_02310 [Candidatus Acidiferrum sp.]
MSSWLDRWSRRQRDLTRGVDADLIQDNRNRYRVAFGLVGFGFLLGLLDAKIQFPSRLHLIAVVMAAAAVVGGLLLAAWARQEAAFLSKPDPEEPPTVFKR